MKKEQVDQTLRRHVLQTVQLLFAPGDVVEVRAPEVTERNRDRTYQAPYFGYFDSEHWEELARQTVDLTDQAAGIYVTLNPCQPALLARRANRLDRASGKSHTTTDRDIIRRRWLPIDCDPVRPAGVSATAMEHQLALDRADAIRRGLSERRWPEPLRADSGNGGHLLYAVDLPNDEATNQLFKRCLQTLNMTWGDDQVTVDESVANAARIWKLYGTKAGKGDSTPERPHRYARLLEPPTERPPCVTLEQLSALAATAHTTTINATSNNRSGAFDVEAWVNEHVDVLSGPRAWQGGRRWVIKCPWDPSHTDRSGYIVQFPSQAIAAGCQHASCQGKGWKELREMLDPEHASKVPRAGSEGNGKTRKGKKEDAPPTPPEIGRMLEGKNRFLYIYETLHVYRDGLYIPEGEPWVRLRTQEILDDDSTKADGNEVVYWLATRHRTRPDLVNSGDRINLQNGLLDWRNEKLHPHSPEELTTVQLPTRWDPNAYHERLDRFLDEILPSRAVRELLEEIIGYALLTDCRFQKAAVLVGKGSNGKSTLLNVVQATFGGPNISNVTLQALAENRFASASLVSKMLNVYADLPRQAIEESDVFKALVTGDFIEVEQKYRPSFTFKNRAKLIFSANELPNSKDLSHGFFRRWIIVPFPRNFKEDGDADPQLEDKLITAEARSYLLLLAVRGLRRLVERGGFPTTAETSSAQEDYLRQCDPVIRFVEDCCIRGGEVSRQGLYNAYTAWCQSEGIKKPLTQVWFSRRIRAHMPEIQDCRPGTDGYRARLLSGISLTPWTPRPQNDEGDQGGDDDSVQSILGIPRW